MGSISRSKMAEEEEWLREKVRMCDRNYCEHTYTDVGEDGIEAGEREPRRWGRRCEL